MDYNDEFIQKTVYKACLELRRPYFGGHLFAAQGDPTRHIYMQAIVERQSARRAAEPLRILELGSWAGGSALTWAGALKRYHGGRGSVVCIDPWRPYFVPSEISPGSAPGGVYQSMHDAAESGEIFELFMHNIKYSGHDDVIIPMRAESDAALPYLGDRAFDIVFVDGAHVYDSVIKDLRNCARLVDQGGIMCGDDLELQLSQVDAQNVERFKNRDFVEDPRSKIWHHPGVTKAVGEFFGEVDCWAGLWAAERTTTGWGRVELPAKERYSIPAHLESAELQFAAYLLAYAQKMGWT